MLADFGIALAVNLAGGNRLTETGLSLGTPQHMSPEQATGDRRLDPRTDIYSLGAVLYEMLAGEPPHTGPTAQAVIAKLMTEQPTHLRTVRNTVSEAVEAAVSRALAKAPADRFLSAADFATALRAAPETAAGRARPRWGLTAAGAVVVSALAVGYLVWQRPGPLPALGWSEQLTADAGLEIQPAISPDGRLVAYAVGTATRMRIFIRPVGGGRTIPLSDDSSSVETQPQWSPDGSMILFLSRGGVSIAPALGGGSRPVVPPRSAAAFVASATWSPNGKEIAFVRGDSLLVAPIEAGPPRSLAAEKDWHSCRWSPDARWIACVALNRISVLPGPSFGNLAPSAIDLIPAAGGRPIRVAEPRTLNQSPGFSVDSRRLYYVSSRNGPRDVYAQEIARSGEPRGEPVRLTTGLGALSISFSADGRQLAYAVYTARANLWSMPIIPGKVVGLESATQLTSGNQVIESVAVAPDGRSLLYDSDLRGNADIYRIPIEGGPVEQLTTDPAGEFAPTLSPDGRGLAYHSCRLGTRDIEVKPLDGGPVEQVTDSPAQESYPQWTATGDIVFFEQVANATLRTRRLGNGRWSVPDTLAVPAQRGALSPAGDLLAYVASPLVPGSGPIWVRPMAPPGVARALFQPSEREPPGGLVVWGSDGRTVYYKAHDLNGMTSFWVISAAGGHPRMIARLADPTRQSARVDFDTDGKRLYFAIEDRESDVFVAELIVK